MMEREVQTLRAQLAATLAAGIASSGQVAVGVGKTTAQREVVEIALSMADQILALTFRD
jgi:hypothetical protein